MPHTLLKCFNVSLIFSLIVHEFLVCLQRLQSEGNLIIGLIHIVFRNEGGSGMAFPLVEELNVVCSFQSKFFQRRHPFHMKFTRNHTTVHFDLNVLVTELGSPTAIVTTMSCQFILAPMFIDIAIFGAATCRKNFPEVFVKQNLFGSQTLPDIVSQMSSRPQVRFLNSFIFII